MRNPLSLDAHAAAPRNKPSNYPEPFASMMKGRLKRPLGDVFGLRNFGVNLTTLEPGARSALQHRHSHQDEFVFVIEGEGILISGTDEVVLRSGHCAGFPANGISHHLENRSTGPLTFIEVGDRTGGDVIDYPQDDLVANNVDGVWKFTRKNGQPY